MPHRTRQTVLITGSTGHVGFLALLHALRAGYRVRATVRSEAKRETLLSHPRIRSLSPGSRLCVLVIPNIAAPRAFDEAVKGVDYIVHIASPIATVGTVPPAQYDSYFIQPAIHGTLGILEAAKRSPSVRRIVVTSSIVALIPLAQLEGREAREAPVSASDRVPFAPGPYSSEFEAYVASKIAALSVTEKWVQTRKPRFDVVLLHPSFVEGRNDLATNLRDLLKGTNTIILGIALGKKFGPFIGATVHNDDVAGAHIKALDVAAVPGNAGYILSQPSRWDDVKQIARKFFPAAVETGMLPLTGSVETIGVDVDTAGTERVFGFTHRNFESQVVNVLGHYLELRGGGAKAGSKVLQPV